MARQCYKVELFLIFICIIVKDSFIFVVSETRRKPQQQENEKSTQICNRSKYRSWTDQRKINSTKRHCPR